MKVTGLLAILAMLTAGGLALADSTAPSPDAHLTIPITMHCVGVRLHDVTEQLTAETGVDIKCGSNKDDYTCRDIPVFVSVKELPLGVMLRTLADVTHLTFAKGSYKDKTYYRIYRDPKRTRQLTDYFEGARQARLDSAKWDWDTLAAAANMPMPDPGKNPQGATAVALANLVSNLGQEARDRVLAGEPITIKPESMPENIKRGLRANPNAVQFRMSQISPNSDASVVSDPTVTFSLPDQDNPGSSGLSLKIQQSRSMDGGKSIWSSWTMVSSVDGYVIGGLYTDHDFVNQLRNSRPKPPDPPKEPESVASRYSRIEEKDMMDKTVKLELPKDTKEVTPSIVILALSKALGYSIFYEDYSYHRTRSDDRLRAVFGKEIKVRDILFGSATSGWYYKPQWRVDAKDKLIIGTDMNWVDRYANLVPANVIDYLAARLNGDGVTFDDMSLLAGLTQAQHQEWIAEHKSLQALRGVTYTLVYDPMWKLYFSLPASQQSRTASSVEYLTEDQKKEFYRYGLPLAEVNQDLLAEVQTRYKRQQQPASGLDDPAASQATIRLVSQQNKDGSYNSYRLIATWLEDGNVKTRETSIWNHFPIYSPEREAELKKKASEKKQ